LHLNPLTKMLRFRWLIFGLLATGYVLVFFHRICPAVLAIDLMHDLKAGGSLTGLLGAAYFYPYAAMQLPAGLLSDSWGPRKTIALFFAVAGVGAFLLGLAPTAAWAIIGRALVGVGVAMLFVPTLKVLSQWFRPQEFAFMTGILIAMGGVGSFTATAPLVWMKAAMGWRNVFLMVGGLTLCLSLLVFVVVRNRPAELGWPNLVEEDRGAQPPIGLAHGIKQVLSSRFFWPLALWFFFNYAVFFSFGGLWAGPYLTHIHGMDPGQVGRVMTVLALGLIVGAPLLSRLSDKTFQARKPVLVLCAGVVVLMTGLLTFGTTTLPTWGLYLVYFILPIFGNTCGVIGFTMAKELFPVSIAGTATGLVNLFCFVGGAISMQLLGYVLEQAGRINDAFSPSGYRAAFGTLLAAALIALGAALLTRETMMPEKSNFKTNIND
jgi:sugar phosphate permease